MAVGSHALVISAFKTLIAGRAAPWRELHATADALPGPQLVSTFHFTSFITSLKWKGSDFDSQATPACSGHQLHTSVCGLLKLSSGTIALSRRGEASEIRGGAADQINPVEAKMQQGVWATAATVGSTWHRLLQHA